MDTKELQTFITLLEQKNYQSASAKLNYAPSTLSKHIQLLEQELGVKLVKWDGRQIVATEDGRRFIPFAQKMLIDYSDSIDAFSETADMRESIAIAGCETGVSAGLVPLFTSFSARHPEIRFEVQTSANARIPDWLRQKYIDLGFLFTLAVAPIEGCQVIPLFREPVCVMTTPANPLTRRGHITMADLDGQKFAYTHDSCCLGEEFRRRLAQSGARPSNVLFLSGLGVTLEYARKNDGVIISPFIATPGYTEKEGLVVLPIGDEPILAWTQIICGAGVALTPGKRALIRESQRFARELAGQYPQQVFLPDNGEMPL